MKFYYQKTNSHGGDLFPQVRISSIENLPIKLTDIDFQDEFVKIVDTILNLKNDDPKANTSLLESEIDQLVYQLYGLTEDEIRIIETA